MRTLLNDDRRLDLIVVGAGPVGLSAALSAHALGLRVTVLEAESARQRNPGSRALFVHQDSLRLLDRASPGLGGLIADFGVVWQRRRTTYRGRQVYDRRYPPGSIAGLPPFTSLRQADTERFLREACATARIPIEWSARVAQVRADATGVRAAADDGRAWSAAYLIGADGGRSTVREAIAVRLDGHRSSDYHVVVDLADEPDRPGPVERVFHYYHPAMAHRHVLIVAFAGGRQVDVQCLLDSDDPERLASPAAVRKWLPQVVDAGYRDRILSVSRYPFLQRVAESFLDPCRRVLLAGEAAHLFAPLGARGMNSGIADADAASAAVATALRATSAERARGALEDYGRCRQAAAYRNRTAAGAALAQVRPSSVWQRGRQEIAARLATVMPRCGKWLDQRPYGPRGTPTATGSGRY